MSTNLISSGTTAREKVNLRTPEVMTAVQEQVESHYRSDIVAGQQFGTILALKLMQNPVFRAQMDLAKAELAGAP